MSEQLLQQQVWMCFLLWLGEQGGDGVECRQLIADDGNVLEGFERLLRPLKLSDKRRRRFCDSDNVPRLGAVTSLPVFRMDQNQFGNLCHGSCSVTGQ